MAVTSIADVLALLGGPGLDDRTREGRARFTAFLCQSKWQPEDLQLWIEECLERGSRATPDYYHALQDLVVSLGSHLGFTVEFGSYGGGGPVIPYDGKWQASTGEEILVEVKCSAWPVGSTNQLSEYMHDYEVASGHDSRQVYGLYAVGDGDYRGLVDQVRGSEHRSRMKVVGLKDLIRLLRLRRALDARMPDEQVRHVICDLLLPFDSIDVASVLDIIQGVAGTLLEPGDGSAAPQAGEADPAWRRSELLAFLDDCQPPQILVLLALCSSQEGRFRRDELIRRMNAVADSVPGLPSYSHASPKTLSAALSRLSKQAGQRNKDALVEATTYSFAIRPAYREWVEEWLERERMLPLRVEPVRAMGGLFAQATA